VNMVPSPPSTVDSRLASGSNRSLISGLVLRFAAKALILFFYLRWAIQDRMARSL
jgi:hypothetical protein